MEGRPDLEREKVTLTVVEMLAGALGEGFKGMLTKQG